MIYKLVFKGVLTNAIDKQQAITIFAKLFSVTEDDAEMRFFSRAIVLKQLTDKKTAEHYLAKLQQMGIVIEIRELPSENKQSDIAIPSKPISPKSVTPKSSTSPNKPVPAPSMDNNTKPQSNRNRLRLIGGITTVVIAIVISVFIYAQRLLDTSVPMVVQRAESILLTPSTIVLGHANIAKMAELEQLFTDTSNDDYRYNPNGEGIINALLAEDINLRRDLEQLVFSMNFNEDTGPYVSAVLAGKFNQSALFKGLSRHYIVNKKIVDGLTIFEMVKENRHTCKMSDPIALTSTDNIIVISHPDNISSIFNQLNTPSVSTVVNQQWVDYRSQHIASIGLLQPDNLKHASSGFMGLMLSGLSKEMKGAQSVFAGLSASFLPPSGSVDIVVNSTDETWLSDTNSRLQKLLTEQQQTASNDDDFISKLINGVAIVDEPYTLGGRFTVDAEMVAEGKKAFESGLSSLISIGGGKPSSSDIANIKDEIDESVKPYIVRIPSLQLPEFESKYGKRYQWQEGPLAASVTSLRMNADNMLEIDVEAAASGLPNAPSSGYGNSGELLITSVSDKNGNELLAKETCGNKINSDPAEMTSYSSDGAVEAKKTVRLVPAAKVGNIAKIEGRIDLAIATQTQATLIAADSDKMVVEQGDMYLRIKSIEGNSVSFVVSGNQQRLLSVRGLNAKKQYLQGSGKSSFGDSQSKSMNVTYKGNVKFVEIVSTVKYKKTSKRFTITNVLPLQRKNEFASLPKAIKPYNLRDWSVVKAVAKSFKPNATSFQWLGEAQYKKSLKLGLMSVYPMKVSKGFNGYNLRGNIKFEMPYVSALEKIAGRVLFEINSLSFENIPPIPVDYMLPFEMNFNGFGNQYKDQSKPEAELRKSIYLHAYQQLKIPLSEEGKTLVDSKLTSLTGDLVFRLPQKVSSQTLNSVALGKRIFVNGVVYKIVELASGGLKVSAEGDVRSLLDIRLLDKEGKQLGNGSSFNEENQMGLQDKEFEPRLLADIRFQGEPDKMQIIYAASETEKRYSVTLKQPKQ